MIVGASGMDYHVFNRVFRDDASVEVVAFTMAVEQNLGTVGGELRRYPPVLAGKHYPDGIPTIREDELPAFIARERIDRAVLAYSDLAYPTVMHMVSEILAAGADFELLSPARTMIEANKPVISVCAVRTGCGKSQTSRKLVAALQARGLRAVAIREPMPYGDLAAQAVMRFATYEDLERHGCTIEEREEYEPYIERGLVIYSGVDYERILQQAEAEADVIVFDGGNNEVSFYVPDVLVVVADPLRPGDEIGSFPGEVNARLADFVVINKEDSADADAIAEVERNLRSVNPTVAVIHADSVVSVDDAAAIAGRRVLVVEDGPTLTHGGMAFGAGFVAAKTFGAASIVDPRPLLPPNLREVFETFDQLRQVLPAMGYSPEQLRELESTIRASDCDVVVSGTPIDLAKIIDVGKPIIRVHYELQEKGKPDLETVVDTALQSRKARSSSTPRPADA